jgi:hypothetical protein
MFYTQRDAVSAHGMLGEVGEPVRKCHPDRFIAGLRYLRDSWFRPAVGAMSGSFKCYAG